MTTSLKFEIGFVLALLLFGIFIYVEHDRGVAQRAQLEDLKRATDAKVVTLEAQAKIAQETATVANAAVIAQLAAQSQALQTAFATLAIQLSASKAREVQQVSAVQTMPIEEIVKLLKAELGSTANYDPVTSTITGIDPLTLRKAQTSMVQLTACNEQNTMLLGQVGNCQQQVGADKAIIDTQKRSLEELSKAADFKDQILEQREVEHKAELKVAKGSFMQRLASTASKIGLGVAIGAAAGYAAHR